MLFISSEVLVKSWNISETQLLCLLEGGEKEGKKTEKKEEKEDEVGGREKEIIHISG